MVFYVELDGTWSKSFSILKEIESGHGCIYLKSVTHLIKIDRAQNIGEVPAFVGKFASNPVALVPSHNNKEWTKSFGILYFICSAAFQILITFLFLLSVQNVRKVRSFLLEVIFCGFEDYPTLSLWLPRLYPPLSPSWTVASRPCHWNESNLRNLRHSRARGRKRRRGWTFHLAAAIHRLVIFLTLCPRIDSGKLKWVSEWGCGNTDRVEIWKFYGWTDNAGDAFASKVILEQVKQVLMDRWSSSCLGELKGEEVERKVEEVEEGGEKEEEERKRRRKCWLQLLSPPLLLTILQISK